MPAIRAFKEPATGAYFPQLSLSRRYLRKLPHRGIYANGFLGSFIPMMLFIVSLAIWRITHLFSKEDGPFELIFRLRKLAGEGVWGQLLDCFYCLSIWISLPFALWTGASVSEKLLFWMAYSGLACLLEKVTEKLG